MTARHAFEPFLILALISGCISTDPCTDYVSIWMANGHRSSDFNYKDTTIPICDAYLNESAWYRFEHNAGNRLVEKPIEPWYCETQAPIWLNGTHPTDTTEITAVVCATFSSTNICGWNGTVRIRLCSESGSEYFVYQLAVPPGCPLAYCVDAASRKQCIPPDVWLEDEFKCGEQSKRSTPAPTTTLSSISPTQIPSFGWSAWGPWSDCSKPCDYNGRQMSRRTCGQLPCTGEATCQQPCTLSNCKEPPEETGNGIVLSLQSANPKRDVMLMVVEKTPEIVKIMRGSINSICSLWCRHKTESVSSHSIECVTYAAKGFPKQNSDVSVLLKIIATFNDSITEQHHCNISSTFNRKRKVRSTIPNFVSFEVMEMAFQNSVSALQETGLVVKIYSAADDTPCPVATCIVPIAVCCAVILPTAIIIGCITHHMMKKSKKTPISAYDKDPNRAAPNMVHPYVRSG